MYSVWNGFYFFFNLSEFNKILLFLVYSAEKAQNGKWRLKFFKYAVLVQYVLMKKKIDNLKLLI